MEKKNAVAIAMEKKGAMASAPAADGVQAPIVPTAYGVQAPVVPAADGVQAPAIPDCKIPLDWDMYEERQYLLPPNPYERSIVDEYPEVTIRV
jgi:hypothetical protein